jgi:hypothetical protein
VRSSVSSRERSTPSRLKSHCRRKVVPYDEAPGVDGAWLLVRHQQGGGQATFGEVEAEAVVRGSVERAQTGLPGRIDGGGGEVGPDRFERAACGADVLLHRAAGRLRQGADADDVCPGLGKSACHGPVDAAPGIASRTSGLVLDGGGTVGSGSVTKQ